MARQAELAELNLPDFGLPQQQPSIPAATCQRRIDVALGRALGEGHAGLIVYGDREHSANLCYLTGYDPRFEESLLILFPGQKPVLLLGNEGMSYSDISQVEHDKVLYQTFSLPGQPRGDNARLAEILHTAGCMRGNSLALWAGRVSIAAKQSNQPTLWRFPHSSSMPWSKSSVSGIYFSTPMIYSCTRLRDCARSMMSINSPASNLPPATAHKPCAT